MGHPEEKAPEPMMEPSLDMPPGEEGLGAGLEGEEELGAGLEGEEELGGGLEGEEGEEGEEEEKVPEWEVAEEDRKYNAQRGVQEEASEGKARYKSRRILYGMSVMPHSSTRSATTSLQKKDPATRSETTCRGSRP